MKPPKLLILLALLFSLSLHSFSEPTASPKASLQSTKKGGKTCHPEPSKEGAVRGICKHCGCRMQFNATESQKLCTTCKCKVKNEACLQHH